VDVWTPAVPCELDHLGLGVEVGVALETEVLGVVFFDNGILLLNKV
jgi:hypothetical protein